MKGTIKRILDVQQVSDSFKKQELHIVIPDEKYPQTLCIEFHQDNCAKLDEFAAGQEVEIEINLRGREWRKVETDPWRVFNTLVGWKIESVGTGATRVDDIKPNQGDDDLPF